VHGGSFWRVVGGTSTIPEARQAQNKRAFIQDATLKTRNTT